MGRAHPPPPFTSTFVTPSRRVVVPASCRLPLRASALRNSDAHFPGRYNGRVAFRICQFRKDDFEQLWAIDQECFPPGISYTRIELAFYMRRAHAFTLVAESVAPKAASGTESAAGLPPGRGIAGFIVGEGSTRGAGHIITIDVRAEARRHRVGTALLQAAEECLRAGGSRHVFLETAVDNAPALAFYKRHGYQLIKTIPRYYKNNLDALLLGKKLTSPAVS